MTKHTAGPWKTVNKPDYASYGGIGIEQDSGSKDENVICEIWPIKTVPVEDPESQANARLIASAPDLLTHLKHMVWLVETELKEDGGHILQGAKTAIAKAEGYDQTFDCNAGDHADCCRAK